MNGNHEEFEDLYDSNPPSPRASSSISNNNSNAHSHTAGRSFVKSVPPTRRGDEEKVENVTDVMKLLVHNPANWRNNEWWKTRNKRMKIRLLAFAITVLLVAFYSWSSYVPESEDQLKVDEIENRGHVWKDCLRFNFKDTSAEVEVRPLTVSLPLTMNMFKGPRPQPQPQPKRIQVLVLPVEGVSSREFVHGYRSQLRNFAMVFADFPTHMSQLLAWLKRDTSRIPKAELVKLWLAHNYAVAQEYKFFKSESPSNPDDLSKYVNGGQDRSWVAMTSMAPNIINLGEDCQLETKNLGLADDDTLSM